MKRSYADDVVTVIERLRSRFDVVQYGELDYAPDRYPLFAIKTRNWHSDLPIVLVTGGVHGYETSGVHGALQFVERHAGEYAGRVNVIVLPCVSPWAYERIHRWNPFAVDPNRSFREPSPAEEAASVMRLIAPLRDRVLVHVDLHETTDSDETEFRPALAARDGKPSEPGEIPDGFYLVDDSANPQPRVSAGDHCCGRQGHAYRTGRRREQDHRFAGGRSGGHRVSARGARSVCRPHEGSLHDDHRGVPRQPARDARSMQRRTSGGCASGDRVRYAKLTVARSRAELPSAREGCMQVPLTLIDFLYRAELVYGERIAVVDEPQPPGGGLGCITYAELGRMARSLAAALDELGVAEGARVAIVSPNSARFLISLFGVSAFGRVLVPINFRLKADEIRYIVEHSGATVLLVDPELEELVRDVPVAHRIVLGEATDAQLFDRRDARAALHASPTRPRPSRSTTPPAPPRGPRACSSRIAAAGSTR